MTIQSDIWIFQEYLESRGLLFRNLIAWKNSSLPVKNRYCIHYQPILFFAKSDKYTFNHKYESRKSPSKLPGNKINNGNLMIDWWDDIPFVSGGLGNTSKLAVKT